MQWQLTRLAVTPYHLFLKCLRNSFQDSWSIMLLLAIVTDRPLLKTVVSSNLIFTFICRTKMRVNNVLWFHSIQDYWRNKFCLYICPCIRIELWA